MYKLNIHSGLGDSLRRLNECRVVVLCTEQNTKCLVSYQDRLQNSWRTENAKTFATLIAKVDCLEYIEDAEAFSRSSATQLQPNDKKFEGLPILNLDIRIGLPEEFNPADYNIALHVGGSTAYKKLRIATLYALCDFLSEQKATIYIVDYPGHYDKNKKLFSKYPAVKVIKSNFPESCKLIQACDLLIAPDSYSKYLDLDKKMLILCTCAPYMSFDLMFSYAFKDLLNKSTIKIIGQTPGMAEGSINDVCQISPEETLAALKELMAK